MCCSSAASQPYLSGGAMWKKPSQFCLFFPIFPLFPDLHLFFLIFPPLFGSFFAVKGHSVPLPRTGYATVVLPSSKKERKKEKNNNNTNLNIWGWSVGIILFIIHRKEQNEQNNSDRPPQIFRFCLFVCLFVCFFDLRATQQWRSQYGAEGQSAPLQRKKCQKQGGNQEKEEKSGRKDKIGKVLSLCPSWQIGLAGCATATHLFIYFLFPYTLFTLGK